MKNRPQHAARNVPLLVGLGCLALAAIAFYSNAGDLDPPSGPPLPSMVTTEDINNTVIELNNALAQRQVWETAVVCLDESVDLATTNTFTLIPSGNGVLHEVQIVCSNSDLELSVWLRRVGGFGGPFAIINRTSELNQNRKLNIRYQDGIEVFFPLRLPGEYDGVGPICVTLLYAPDE